MAIVFTIGTVILPKVRDPRFVTVAEVDQCCVALAKVFVVIVH